MTTMKIVQTGQDIHYSDTKKFVAFMRTLLREDLLEETESFSTGYSTDDQGLHSIYLKTLKSTSKTYFARVSVVNSSGLVSEITICSD